MPFSFKNLLKKIGLFAENDIQPIAEASVPVVAIINPMAGVAIEAGVTAATAIESRASKPKSLSTSGS